MSDKQNTVSDICCLKRFSIFPLQKIANHQFTGLLAQFLQNLLGRVHYIFAWCCRYGVVGKFGDFLV